MARQTPDPVRRLRSNILWTIYILILSKQKGSEGACTSYTCISLMPARFCQPWCPWKKKSHHFLVIHYGSRDVCTGWGSRHLCTHLWISKAYCAGMSTPTFSPSGLFSHVMAFLLSSRVRSVATQSWNAAAWHMVTSEQLSCCTG